MPTSRAQQQLQRIDRAPGPGQQQAASVAQAAAGAGQAAAGAGQKRQTWSEEEERQFKKLCKEHVKNGRVKWKALMPARTGDLANRT